MDQNCRVALRGSEYFINDSVGATVAACTTAEEANQKMQLCQHDDLTLSTARSLGETAVAAHIRMHNIDRETAHEWIRESMR